MRDLAIILGLILIVFLVDRAIMLAFRAIEGAALSRTERELRAMFSGEWPPCVPSAPQPDTTSADSSTAPRDSSGS
jgi:hypothetical protein